MSAHANGVQEQRKMLENRIFVADAELRSLKLSYNSLCDLNKLPVEILSNVFISCAAEATQQFSSTDRSSFSWINVAHVCHHWREVALGCAELWANILFINEGLARFMLAQSKAAPLSIDIHITRSWQREFINDLASQIHRWRAISLEGHLDLFDWSDWSSQAPLLEKLVIRSFEWCSELEQTALLFQGNAPVLKHLALEGMGVQSYTVLPFSPSLTYLELEEDQDQKIWPCGADLLRTLQHLPLLESLILINCVPEFGQHRTSLTPTRIHFPSIRALSLAGYVDSVQGFLDSVQIHENASLTFNLLFTVGSDHVKTLNQFTTSLTSAWIPAITVQELSVDDTADLDSTLQFRFYSRVRDAGAKVKPQLKIAFRGLEDSESNRLEEELQVPFLSVLTKTMVDFAHLRRMKMKSENDFSVDVWAEMFGVLPKLEEITFDVAEIDNFLKALNKTADSSIASEVPGSSPLFPTLANMTIKHMPFWNSSTKGDFGTLLVEALNSRPVNHRLKFLHVADDCHTSDWHELHEGSGISLLDFVTKNLLDTSASWEDLGADTSDDSDV
ncbi:hypothetical protein NMY22_g12919 [Coprinellus aureogranulatus]|nr:hypothetical protein NMY22_g12919 [Coprinellus aureogranulatus]